MKISKKGVAVDTVVLIILAVIVLALVGYLIYKTWGEGKCKIDSTICLAARMDCCCAGGTFDEVEKACGESCNPNQLKTCEGTPCSGGTCAEPSDSGPS